MRDRIRSALASVTDRLDRRLHPGTPHRLRLEVPPSAELVPRYGYGRPRHAGLESLLARHTDTYREELTAVAQFTVDLRAIPLEPDGSDGPCWINAWLLGLDTASLYTYLRRWQPARYVEVGSGNSTAVVARARADGNLSTHITSIDPAPRRSIDALCDRVVRRPLELVDLELFADLRAGDVLFVDGSHRVFTNSDAAVVFLDVLPQLPDGVLVGIHDILWPDDYPPEWSGYWFNEQYLLGALLLGEPRWLVPLLACNYVAQQPALAGILSDLWRAPLDRVDQRGFSFWFRVHRDR